MNKSEITKLLASFTKNIDRNIVIVDFANVDRWQDSLGWSIGKFKALKSKIPTYAGIVNKVK